MYITCFEKRKFEQVSHPAFSVVYSTLKPLDIFPSCLRKFFFSYVFECCIRLNTNCGNMLTLYFLVRKSNFFSKWTLELFFSQSWANLQAPLAFFIGMEKGASVIWRGPLLFGGKSANLSLLFHRCDCMFHGTDLNQHFCSGTRSLNGSRSRLRICDVKRNLPLWRGWGRSWCCCCGSCLDFLLFLKVWTRKGIKNENPIRFSHTRQKWCVCLAVCG